MCYHDILWKIMNIKHMVVCAIKYLELFKIIPNVREFHVLILKIHT
jgi:hypothetical protein